MKKDLRFPHHADGYCDGLTWRGILERALPAGLTLALAQIYARVKEHCPQRVARNPTWQATVRRTLQQHPRMTRVSKGHWEYQGPDYRP